MADSRNFYMARSEARGSVARLNKRITIAGGGLAGLSLAIALRGRGVPVMVLEAGSYPRHRVCGEFISGVTTETLEYLGIRDLFDDARQHHSICWHEGGGVMHHDHLPEPALGISRFMLDERLRRRLDELGGELKTGTRARPVPEEGLVWAAGRRPRKGRWIGLKGHFRGLPMTADLDMHSGSNGYLGLAAVEDGWVNACGLFRLDRRLEAEGRDLRSAPLAERRDRLEALLDQLPAGLPITASPRLTCTSSCATTGRNWSSDFSSSRICGTIIVGLITPHTAGPIGRAVTSRDNVFITPNQLRV